MEVDYIIVGFGLAGMAFADILADNNKTFLVYEDASQTSSNVAGGVYNPVVLKRFTPVWQGKQQIEDALPFYKKLENKFSAIYDHTFDTYRVFKSIEEQNNWFVASEKPLLNSFMDDKIVKNSNTGIIADYGFGRLKNTGRIDTKLVLQDYKKLLEQQKSIRYETFDYDELNFKEEKVHYKDVLAKKVVFCEGYGLHKNPFFQHLPMNEAKGELLTIYAPELDVDFLIKASVFVLPLGNHQYKVGATFNWKDKSLKATEEGKKELLEKLDSFIKVPYKVLAQSAGIRPTVKDRRPLVGIHKEYKELAVLNGLGTRGVMIAPKVAKELYEYLEMATPLDPECDIQRFYKK
ncbi:NAD(P)/FAD-dependent oxidoreductase [Flavicella sediminum]|uniref:NAD(P)/FAD-dependent oxidoreductase n=1 Tax=Flavicella sediminum TaxID=2585141 RepID=UPI00111D8E82|nr:FAD-binding oxidoreductase [Flavicella sediminum]